MQHDAIQVIIFQVQINLQISDKAFGSNTDKQKKTWQLNTFFEFPRVRNLDSIKVALQLLASSGMFAVLK